MKGKMVYLLLIVTALFVAITSSSYAGVISSTNGKFQVGIGPDGELFDYSSGVGFLRVADGYDPIAPGTPRDSWGVSAGTTSGYADQAFYGVSNISSTSTYGANTASVSSWLNDGVSNLLQVNESYSFAASNVVEIQTTVSNLTSSTQSVLFRRDVDWDVAPTEFNEMINVPAQPSFVSSASYYGFENPDPTSTFMYQAAATGGTYGPGDQGGGFTLDLGSLASNTTSTFDIYYALNYRDQSGTDLTTELDGLGANYVITGYSSDGNMDTATNFAALGVSVPSTGPSPVPEPSSMVALAGGLFGMIGMIRRRKA
jgi:hypothetical protein